MDEQLDKHVLRPWCVQVSANISVITFDEDEPAPLDSNGEEWPDLFKKQSPKLPGYAECGYSDKALMRHLHGQGNVMNFGSDADDLSSQIGSTGTYVYGGASF